MIIAIAIYALSAIVALVTQVLWYQSQGIRTSTLVGVLLFAIVPGLNTFVAVLFGLTLASDWMKEQS